MDMKDFVRFGKKIVGAGRNYKSLAAEQGRPIPDQPILFLKPTTSYLEGGGVIEVPASVKELYYEVELGVVIDRDGRDIPESSAMSYVGGYVVALDMTSSTHHAISKQKGHPWSVSKGFDTFCPVSPFIEKEKVDPTNCRLWLKVDGDLKQDGSTADMIFSIPYLISYISGIFRLEKGDLILTGTPAGVGPVEPGQTITAGIEGVVEIKFPVVKRSYSN